MKFTAFAAAAMLDGEVVEDVELVLVEDEDVEELELELELELEVELEDVEVEVEVAVGIVPSIIWSLTCMEALTLTKDTLLFPPEIPFSTSIRPEPEASDNVFNLFTTSC